MSAPSSTALYAASQGMGAAVNNNADSVYLDVRPSDGLAANVGLLNRGEADIATLSNNVAYRVKNGLSPFDNTDFTLTQVGHIHTSDWCLVSSDPSLKKWSDISPSTRVSPAMSGTAARMMWSPALEDVAGLDYKSRSINYGNQGSALSSDRIDVGVVAYVNTAASAIEPSWVQQIKSTADVGILDISDDTVADLEENEQFVVRSLSLDQFDGWQYRPSPADLLTMASYTVAPAKTSESQVYTMLKTMWEHKQKLSDYHALLKFHQDGEWWVKEAFSDVPFHPGAAKFYKEIGVWKENFTVA